MIKIKLWIRQYGKMLLQYGVLPFVYQIEKRKNIKQRFVVLADSHQEKMPESMLLFSQELKKRGYYVKTFFFQERGIKGIGKMISFMRVYAQAVYVILCDYFLPVASCRKRKETTVIQLWHACGLLKKCGYSTTDDIPAVYHGNLFRNYDLVTVSGESCREKMAEAMRLPKEKVQALGVSRTDIFWKEGYQKSCRRKFFSLYPEAVGKKIVLWAPTFRGRAFQPYVVGETIIQEVEEQLKENYYFISHFHPHIKQKKKEQQKIMELLPAVDCLITDYSSVFYEFLLFKKPVIFFVPDYETYQETRGFYIDLRTLPARWAQRKEELLLAITQPYSIEEQLAQRDCCKTYLSACDGHATERILDWMELVKVQKKGRSER